MPRLPQNISTYYAVKSFASNESEMCLKIELSRHKVLLLIKQPTTFITFRPNVDLQYDITPPNCNLGRPEFSRIFTYFLTRGKQKPLFWPAELILIGILKTVYPTGKVLVSKLGLVLWSNYIYLKRLFGAEIVPLLSFADTGTITSANNLDSRSCYFNSGYEWRETPHLEPQRSMRKWLKKITSQVCTLSQKVPDKLCSQFWQKKNLKETAVRNVKNK